MFQRSQAKLVHMHTVNKNIMHWRMLARKSLSLCWCVCKSLGLHFKMVDCDCMGTTMYEYTCVCVCVCKCASTQMGFAQIENLLSSPTQ